MKHHVVIEIDGVAYEGQDAPEYMLPCILCGFERSTCGLSDFCIDTLGDRGYFKKVEFDDILKANRDVLQRLKMGIVPSSHSDDDSEFIND